MTIEKVFLVQLKVKIDNIKIRQAYTTREDNSPKVYPVISNGTEFS